MKINRVSGNYGTHMFPLIRCMEKTSGDVLEMGTGMFSTPYLHYKCLAENRRLVSIDNHEGWLNSLAGPSSNFNYANNKHTFQFVEDWNKAEIDYPWEVALIDHSPGERRKEDVRRITKLARYIIIHDSNPEFDKEYGYSEIYPLFRHRRVWDGDSRHATVLSNFISLEDLW